MRIIAGRWKGHGLTSVRGGHVRPTTDRIREAWMSSLGGALLNARVLDLFAGSGALGLEALSRGAREVVFVEKSGKALRTLEKNVRTLGASAEVTVLRDDALRYVRGLEAGAFDVALADPPYSRGFAAELVRLYLETRFAGELWVEHRTSDDLPDAPGARQRRYGDTTLTILEADDPDHE